jgi:hypothetical protein
MPISGKNGSADMRASLLAPDILPLFDDAFVRSCDLYEEYVFRLTLDVFRRLGLEATCRGFVTTDEAIAKSGFDARVPHVPLDWETIRGASIVRDFGTP